MSFPLFVIIILYLPLAHTDPSGFINIDCGLPPGKTSYDEITGLTYSSDASYIAAGEAVMVPPENYKSLSNSHLAYVRSFPLWNRNCYNISLVKDKKYLIKAVFCYLNHDNLNTTLSFDLYLGNSKWATLRSDFNTFYTKEVVHAPTRNYVFVCLVNTGTGTPFISALEVREMDANLYQTNTPASLALSDRRYVRLKDNNYYRYPSDVFDRKWLSLFDYDRDASWRNITTNKTVKSPDKDSYKLPSAVMSTAITPTNAADPIKLSSFLFYDFSYLIYLHFAELVVLEKNQSRAFYISVNELKKSYFSPQFLIATTWFSNNPVVQSYNVTISASENSTLPPLLNAYEVYYVVNDTSSTQQNEVDTLLAIKSTYKIVKNWEGDPCGPQGHQWQWQGVNCSFSDSTFPFVVSLDLSDSNLGGSIAHAINNLKNLKKLDLSNNFLTGPIPEFLSSLPSLTVINLSGNNLTGRLPESLVVRSKTGSLSLNVTGNPRLCLDHSCGKTKKRKNLLVVVAAIVGGTVAALAVAAALAFLCWRKKGKKQSKAMTEPKPVIELSPNTVSLTYANILEITNNLASVIARGGSGMVYHGTMNKSPVAVKIISQDPQQFQMEVNYLLQIHHNNLTKLVGYCNEGNHLAVIYQYMQNGNLRDALQNESVVLDWNQRIHIALDSAQGLDYLHHHCTPPIIHRDVKAANILLDAEFRAKISDFGLSKSSPRENGTLRTRIVGTPGYIDPEYWETSMVNIRSDVYSFGIVLLEIISGRNSKGSDRCGRDLVAYAESNVRSGDIRSIIDPKLNGDFESNSAWVIVELALECTSCSSSSRPTMLQVLLGLQGCIPNDQNAYPVTSYFNASPEPR